MTPIARFALRPLGEGGRAELLDGGAATGLALPGVVLEAQFAVGPGFLLLATEDVPFEEALHAVLLSPALSVLDEAELSAPYTPGVLRDLAPGGAGDDSLGFAFGGAGRMRLRVLPRPRRAAGGLLRRPLGRALAPKWLEVVEEG